MPKASSVWAEEDEKEGEQGQGPEEVKDPKDTARGASRKQRERANKKGELYGWRADHGLSADTVVNEGQKAEKIRRLTPEEHRALKVETFGTFDGGYAQRALYRPTQCDDCSSWYQFPHSCVRCLSDGLVVPAYSRKLVCVQARWPGSVIEVQ